jgi:hypothetical protein
MTSHREMKTVHVKVRGGSNSNVKLELPASDPVSFIKRSISEKESVPADSVTLLFRGKNLLDNDTLQSISAKSLYILARLDKPSEEVEEKERLECVNECGFFGDPRNDGYCSVCYKDLHYEESSGQESDESSYESSGESIDEEPKTKVGMSVGSEKMTCGYCKKRLHIWFLCECGKHFCTGHRSPFIHKCSYDRSDKDRKRLRDQLESQQLVPNKIQKI